MFCFTIFSTNFNHSHVKILIKMKILNKSQLPKSNQMKYLLRVFVTEFVLPLKDLARYVTLFI